MIAATTPTQQEQERIHSKASFNFMLKTDSEEREQFNLYPFDESEIWLSRHPRQD